jgi:hypothetical protein
MTPAGARPKPAAEPKPRRNRVRTKPDDRFEPLDRKRSADAALAELRLAERRGEVAPAADWLAAQLQIADAVRETVLGVAGVAVSRGLVAPADEAKLDKLLRDALRALGGQS